MCLPEQVAGRAQQKALISDFYALENGAASLRRGKRSIESAFRWALRADTK
jgi:hypothetical protein